MDNSATQYYVLTEISKAIEAEKKERIDEDLELLDYIKKLEGQIDELENPKSPEDLNTYVTTKPKFEIGELVIKSKKYINNLLDNLNKNYNPYVSEGRKSGYIFSYDTNRLNRINLTNQLEVKEIIPQDGKYLYKCWDKIKGKIVENFEENLQLYPNNKYGDLLDKLVYRLIKYIDKNPKKNDNVIKKYKYGHIHRKSSGMFEGIDLHQEEIRLDESQQPETELMKRTREAVDRIFSNIGISNLDSSLSSLNLQKYLNDKKYKNGLYLYHPDIGKRHVNFDIKFLSDVIDELNSTLLGGKKRRKTKKARKSKKNRKSRKH